MKKRDFREIYDQYHSLVSQIAYDVVEDYHLAQDITQDVFAKLYQKREEIDFSRIKGWLITCATRKAIDYRRKNCYEKEVAGGEEISCICETDSAEYELIRREIYGQILTELYKKNRQWFEVVMRLDIEGEPPETVAREMGITLNNLRVKHHRAKSWLNEHFIKKE